MEHSLDELERGVDGKLLSLRRSSKIGQDDAYPGAVVIQSSATKIVSPGKHHIYGEDTFKYATGHIWCYETGLDKAEGSDYVGLGDQPLKHRHDDTKAETTTSSFSTNRGGGHAIGDFNIGNRMMVSQDGAFGDTVGTRLSAKKCNIQYNNPDDGQMTYPLYGQNAIDFRNRKRTHNNVPPSTNVYVKYFVPPSTYTLPATKFAVFSREAVDNGEWKTAEMQYDSLRVPDMDEYTSIDLTTHDYLLRMTLDGKDEDGDVKLMRQSV